MFDVAVWGLPRRGLLESREKYAIKMEKAITDLLELIPHDYKVKVKISNIFVAGEPNPRFVFFIIEKEEA